MSGVTGGEGVRVARLSPRRFWIIGNAPLMKFAPEHGAAMALDEGRVSTRLAGTQARRVLPQVMAVDWNDPHTATGRIVLSAVHRVPVVVLLQPDGDHELIVARSFAASIGGLVAELDGS